MILKSAKLLTVFVGSTPIFADQKGVRSLESEPNQIVRQLFVIVQMGFAFVCDLEGNDRAREIDWKPRTLITGRDSCFGMNLEVAAEDCVQLVRTGSDLRIVTGQYHSFESHSRFLHHPFRTFVVGIAAGLYPS